ncbi:MAG: eno 2 [Sporomusa sp.]|nr:eno 2 [Sporomusa sp.]
MAKITKIIAREIINLWGNATVELDVILSDGTLGRVAVPSCIFPNMYEVVENRGINKPRYFGRRIMKYLESVNNIIAAKVVGMDSLDQAGVDRIMLELEGLHPQGNLGANTILAVSLAVAKAAAASLNMPLYRYLGDSNTRKVPVPMLNLLSGGKNSGSNLDFREYMIVPVGHVSFAEAIRMCTKVYHVLGRLLESWGRSTSSSNTGGFLTNLASNEEGLAVLIAAIKEAGYKPGKQISLALNVSATAFFDGGEYNFSGEGFIKTPVELVEYYTSLVDEYPIVSIEGGMARSDLEGWGLLYTQLGGKIELVDHSLFTTINPKRLEQCCNIKKGNAVPIKINQVTTLSEIINMSTMAKSSGYSCIISHYPIETEDDVIADVAVGINAAQIKGGAPATTHQVAVYNRLLRIEEEIGKISK